MVFGVRQFIMVIGTLAHTTPHYPATSSLYFEPICLVCGRSFTGQDYCTHCHKRKTRHIITALIGITMVLVLVYWLVTSTEL